MVLRLCSSAHLRKMSLSMYSVYLFSLIVLRRSDIHLTYVVAYLPQQLDDLLVLMIQRPEVLLLIDHIAQRQFMRPASQFLRAALLRV
jgi:hypothetical protein